MDRLLKPNIYTKNIFSINYKKLKENNIKHLFFDLDNTIADKITNKPSKEVIELFSQLKKEGFTIYIISNAFKNRVTKFSIPLDVKYYYLSCKPLKTIYKKIIKENNLKTNEIAAIGDEIFTDIKGANKMNILSIYIDRISKHEYFLTKISRIREKYLFKRSKIIKRGEYYE